MSEIERQQVELFRRRRFEAPHRRRHPLRRLLEPFVAALAVVGIPAAAAWWIVTSSQFEIRHIDVVPTQRVSAEWAGERLDALAGRHLLNVRLAEIEHLLTGHPWIADLTVRRELPGRLTVEVAERVPAALWSAGGELSILDAAGRPIAPLGGDTGPLDLPVVFTAVDSATVGAAATEPVPGAAAAIEVTRRWELLRPGDRVSQIEILRSADFRLVTRSLPFTVVVDADRLDEAPDLLARVWPVLESGGQPTLQTQEPSMPPIERVASVDLRFSRQIVFQPAAVPPGEEG